MSQPHPEQPPPQPAPPAGTGQWGAPPPAAGNAPPAQPAPQYGYAALPPTYGAPPPPPPGPPQERGTNGFAIASLILGIVAPCGAGLLSVIFGILALVQIKKTGQKGRGLAIGGLAATGAWVLAIVALIAVAIILDDPATRDDDGEITSGGQVSTDSLRIGDCLNDLREGNALRLDAVPCSEPHEGEVFALFKLADGDYPGEEAVFAEANEGCVDRLTDFPDTYEDDSVDIFYFYPSQISWRTGDREIVCLTYYLDGQRTGSIRD